jgi:hypothetical protein
MSNNDTFSGDGKKGEEELLDFDFETSSGEDVGNEGSDFSLDEEILELVDIVEPGGDIEDSESDEIAKLLQEEPVEEPEEKVLDLELEELDKPREEDTSQILESDIGSVLDDLELSEDGIDEVEKLFEDSESDEIAKLLQEEPVEEPEEKVLDLELEELDKPREEDTSQILESDIGSVLDDLELSEDGVDEGEKLFEDSESDEIAKLLQEEPDEEDVGFEEETELDLEELEQIPEEDETQAFEADLDTTIARMEPAEEVDTELQLDEGDLESIYDDEALGVAKVEDEELAGLEESQEAPVGDGDTFDLGPETPPEIPYEDLSGVSEITEGALEDDMLSHLGQEITGISEERIESIIREVVEDVVERVARETMVTVAEKLIKSAIDALKESIESSRD